MPTIALRHCNSPLRKTRAFFKFLLQLRKKIRFSCIHYTTIGKTRTGLGQRFALFFSPGLRLHLKGAPLNRISSAFRTMQMVGRLSSFKFSSDWLFQCYIRVLLFSERLSLRPNTLISVYPFILHRLSHLGPIISEEEEARPIYLWAFCFTFIWDFQRYFKFCPPHKNLFTSAS